MRLKSAGAGEERFTVRSDDAPANIAGLLHLNPETRGASTVSVVVRASAGDSLKAEMMAFVSEAIGLVETAKCPELAPRLIRNCPILPTDAGDSAAILIASPFTFVTVDFSVTVAMTAEPPATEL